MYSTFGYLAAAVRSSVPELVVETVPGITAMQALAAASGTVLVEGHEPLTLLPLPSGDGSALDAALGLGGTVVVYKGGRHLGEIAAALDGRHAVLGEHVGLPDERISADLTGPAPYLSTVLIPARREVS